MDIKTGIAITIAVVVVIAFFVFGVGLPNTSDISMQDQGGVQPQAATELGDIASVLSNATSYTDLHVQDVTVGTGAEAAAGTTVTVDYVGALPDGTIFDASQNHGQTFSFKLGAGQVIKGWDMGVAGMKEGGKRLLIIPASLGYGANAVGPIPANSTLIFEVTLHTVAQ